MIITIEKKLDILKKIDQGLSLAAVAQEFGLGKSTVSDIKGAVPLETAALNRRWKSFAMYLFLVVCSVYAYFVVAVETDTNRQLL